MGVFKWFRRERLSSGSRRALAETPTTTQETPDASKSVGTIRTEQYKQDLAEFQARRSSGKKDDFETPNRKPKKTAGCHSLPVPCTGCTSDVADTSFDYDQKSAQRYKKNKSKNCSVVEDPVYERVPNIQFMFSNHQVFMPGNIFAQTSYSEVQEAKAFSERQNKRHIRQRSVYSRRTPDMDFLLTQRQIDFEDDYDESRSPPLFFKNNSLPFDVNNFLEGSKSENDLTPEVVALSQNLTKISEHTVMLEENADENDGCKSDSCEEKLSEVMNELKIFDQWADEQLKLQSFNSSKSEDSKSDISFGLPLVTQSDVDIDINRDKKWSFGQWGSVAIQVKKLEVKLEEVKKRQCAEVEILRKFRHPNIVLLMGLYADASGTVHLLCERCVNSLYGIIHLQGRILSAQTSVQYVCDISSALVFLHMQGYIHTEVNSSAIMITRYDVAKLVDLSSCGKYPRNHGQDKARKERLDSMYSPEPQYVNISDKQAEIEVPQDCEPLLSANSSEVYLSFNAVTKSYKIYEKSDFYRWHAPELFKPDEHGNVYPCSRSDVYSLSLVLWECCNAAIPWKSLSYDKLSELYLLWKTGIRLPRDGTYPGGLLDLMQSGLDLERDQRPDVITFSERLQVVKSDLDNIEYILIPERLNKTSGFSVRSWDQNSCSVQTSDSEQNIPKIPPRHKVQVHKKQSSSDPSEKPIQVLYKTDMFTVENTETLRPNDVEICNVSIEELNVSKKSEQYNENLDQLKIPTLKLIEKEIHSSNCSTPVSKKVQNRNEVESPEYCTIKNIEQHNKSEKISPKTVTFPNVDSGTPPNSPTVENASAKLSRSFTPKSYKPLEIKVPHYENLDCLKSLPRENRNSHTNKPTYNFDIRNYSLPTTPIARSNKLRKNAWLSGDINVHSNDCEAEKKYAGDSNLMDSKKANSAPVTPGLQRLPIIEQTIPEYEKTKVAKNNHSKLPEITDISNDESEYEVLVTNANDKLRSLVSDGEKHQSEPIEYQGLATGPNEYHTVGSRPEENHIKGTGKHEQIASTKEYQNAVNEHPNLDIRTSRYETLPIKDKNMINKGNEYQNDGNEYDHSTMSVDYRNLSIDSEESGQDSVTGLKKTPHPNDFYSFETDQTTDNGRSRSHSWSYRSTLERPDKYYASNRLDTSQLTSDRTEISKEDEVLAKVNVKPLVAIHERWIYEANKKCQRSMSLPDNRLPVKAVKPASHCVDTLQTSLPQLTRRTPTLRPHRCHSLVSPTSPTGSRRDSSISQARDALVKSMTLTTKEGEKVWKEKKKCINAVTSTRNDPLIETSQQTENEKSHQGTNTSSLDDFIKQLIRKEFYQLIQENDDKSSCNEDMIKKGTAKILEALNSPDIDIQSTIEDINAEERKNGMVRTEQRFRYDNDVYKNSTKTDNKTSNSVEDKLTSSIKSPTNNLKTKELPKSCSILKIKGNNKPLLQITFGRSGENSLQVLDNCVNVNFLEHGSPKSNKSDRMVVHSSQEEINSIADDSFHCNSLKRCQTFTALQEAKSLEDLYIDDELSTQMNENFGGKVKLIPLHGSLHEILCEKEDDCCLIKVKEENGCDTIYFRCDNSELESNDAIDGLALKDKPQDKLVFKRSISLVEERIERICPRGRTTSPNKRPKSESFFQRPKTRSKSEKVTTIPVQNTEYLQPLSRRNSDILQPISRPKSDIVLSNPLQKVTRASRSTPCLFVQDKDKKKRKEDYDQEINIDQVRAYDSSSDESLRLQVDQEEFEQLEKKIDEDFSLANISASLHSPLEKISEENLSLAEDEDIFK